MADGNHHRSLFHQRIPIAELAGIGAFGGHLGQILQQIVTDHSRMPGGALRGENVVPGLHQIARMVGQPAQHNPAFFLLGPSAQAIADGVGLLENFLEHEMLVIAQFVFFELVFQLRNDWADFDVVDGGGAK